MTEIKSAPPDARQLPGDLEFLTPHCPICAEYTDAEDGGFSCYRCGVAWDKRGENPERIDPDAKQCPSLYKPGCGRQAEEEFRCWQDAGHEDDHHNPDWFWSWATAEQTGEADA